MKTRRQHVILRSITSRLTLGLTLATTLLWCAASLYAIHIASSELKESFDRVLVEVARYVLPLAANDLAGRGVGEAPDGHGSVSSDAARLRYQIRNSSGQVVMPAHSGSAVTYLDTERAGFRSIGKYRLFTRTDATTGLTITVAAARRDRMEAVRGTALAMLLPLAGLIPLNILAIVLVVRGSMRRVRQLGEEIAERSERNLAPLDVSSQPAELTPVAVAITRLVERLRVALEAERAFSANSAHELRTPLAGALAQTQRLIAELPNGRDRRRVYEVEATLKRLSLLVDRLMQLTRVDAGIGISAAEVDLTPALELVIADYRRGLKLPQRVSYTRAPGALLMARMDIDAFAIAVRNLIENAITHGQSKGEIEVRVETTGIVRVINGGPPIAADTLGRLKRRFVRGSTESTGAGLGLAIVETLMERIGGRLTLFSPVPGRVTGFEARLTLNVGAGRPTGDTQRVDASAGA